MKSYMLNAIMFLLFLMVMSFHFLPKMLHELLGLACFLTVTLHLLRNKAWFSSLRKGRYTAFRGISVFIDGLLLGGMATVTITGCFISNHIFKGLFGMELHRSILVHQLHVSLPFLLLILSGLHLGLHWQSLWQCFIKWRRWDSGSVAYRWGSRLTAAFLMGLGIVGLCFYLAFVAFFNKATN